MDINGIQIKDPVPGVAGTFKGPLLIIGCGRGVWEDLHQIDHDHWKGDKMVVKDIGAYYYRPIDHWFTRYPEHLPGWVGHYQRRMEKAGKTLKSFLRHAQKEGPSVDHVWRFEGMASHLCSGLRAIVVGLALGYDEVVLAGIPKDNSGHFYSSPYEDYFGNHSEERFGEEVMQHMDRLFRGRVSSLSGNTKKWLGAPNL